MSLLADKYPVAVLDACHKANLVCEEVFHVQQLSTDLHYHRSLSNPYETHPDGSLYST